VSASSKNERYASWFKTSLAPKFVMPCSCHFVHIFTIIRNYLMLLDKKSNQSSLKGLRIWTLNRIFICFTRLAFM